MGNGNSIFDQLRSLFGKSKPSKSSQTEAPRVDDSPPKRPSQSPTGPEIDLVLGIDFGTSCSKVVIGDRGWQALSYAVPVGGNAVGLDRFLRVTQVTVECAVEANLKMRLTADPNSERLRDLVALYLAGVVRDSLRWFRLEGPVRYRDRRLSWSLNLGFPAKKVETGPLADAYREIAELAVRLGSSELPFNLASVRLLRSGPQTGEERRLISRDRIHLYPEIGAQLAGYVNSPYRTGGNLILIDVGAGTLDVSTIILHGDEEGEIVSFHFCEVGPFGTMKLLEARMAALEEVESGAVRVCLEDFQSGSKPTPETAAELLGSREGLSTRFKSAFTGISEIFSDKAIWLAVGCARDFRMDQRRTHANTGFDPWPQNLRLFFTGGGSRSHFFREHFIKGPLEQTLVPFTRWEREPGDRRRLHQGLRLERLPAPPDLQGLPPELKNEFDRLSVAHGLSYGIQNLMRFT